jgi:hypothetical protein
MPSEALLIILNIVTAVINEAHEKTTRRTHEETLHALRAGDALLTAEAVLPESSFHKWIDAFCRCTLKEAEVYMSLAKGAATMPIFNTLTKPVKLPA